MINCRLEVQYPTSATVSLMQSLPVIFRRWGSQMATSFVHFQPNCSVESSQSPVRRWGVHDGVCTIRMSSSFTTIKPARIVTIVPFNPLLTPPGRILYLLYQASPSQELPRPFQLRPASFSPFRLYEDMHHTLLWNTYSISLFLLVQVTLSLVTLTNYTIDDTFGDELSGLLPIYQPSNGFSLVRCDFV
jgi:hypothetical protein